MSVAILPMKAQFGWDSTTMGLVQSSFFWGYLLTQVRGGHTGAAGRRGLPACPLARTPHAHHVSPPSPPPSSRNARARAQIAGGIWADRYGGKVVLGLGVLWWSAATALTPWAAAQGLPTLLAARALMGIGEGVAMPAMNTLLSK